MSAPMSKANLDLVAPASATIGESMTRAWIQSDGFSKTKTAAVVKEEKLFYWPVVPAFPGLASSSPVAKPVEPWGTDGRFQQSCRSVRDGSGIDLGPGSYKGDDGRIGVSGWAGVGAGLSKEAAAEPDKDVGAGPNEDMAPASVKENENENENGNETEIDVPAEEDVEMGGVDVRNSVDDGQKQHMTGRIKFSLKSLLGGRRG